MHLLMFSIPTWLYPVLHNQSQLVMDTLFCKNIQFFSPFNFSCVLMCAFRSQSSCCWAIPWDAFSSWSCCCTLSCETFSSTSNFWAFLWKTFSYRSWRSISSVIAASGFSRSSVFGAYAAVRPIVNISWLEMLFRHMIVTLDIMTNR